MIRSLNSFYFKTSFTDDTGTINLPSVEAALKAAGTLGKEQKVVLLGNINLLGDCEKEFRSKKSLDPLVTIGEKAKEIGSHTLRDRLDKMFNCFQR